jgi:hypothetical protein
VSEAPDIAGEIVAWRAWWVDWGWVRPTLLSMNDTRWPRGDWLRAECGCSGETDEDGPPCEGRHGCGIHAARDRAHLVDMDYPGTVGRRMHRAWELGVGVAIGEVGLAGKVVEGTQGWRAARARPLRLWVPHASWSICRPLSDAYGVPCGVTNVLKEADEWT